MTWLANERGNSEYSRRLPPPEAWKHPDRWLDPETHKARHDASKLYLYPDDRAFLMPDSAIRQVKEAFFWDDYDWPFDPNDPETRPDDHHMHYERKLYHPDLYEGDTAAHDCRETPAMIARLPRQFHNAIHDLTMMPSVPERDAMREFADSYSLAQQIFSRLYSAARLALLVSEKFNLDQNVDEDILRTTFARHFVRYSAAVDEFNELPTSAKTNLDMRLAEARLSTPTFVVRKLGAIANRGSIDLVPVLRHAA